MLENQVHNQRFWGCFVVKIAQKNPPKNLGKALLAVVFKVFGVNVDVVPIDTVRLRELGGFLDELLHLHGWLVFAQVFKGPHWYVRRGDAV